MANDLQFNKKEGNESNSTKPAQASNKTHFTKKQRMSPIQLKSAKHN
ncbi:hypothetical protein QG37_07234 [Candidozyma auris]|uniref:Uncharacterized protein n=1 Tax=Candidozyma auris TaxID=498019 RepID=A0A0L0NS50_CANAR|nr:hypothetical protein QG37_07234 [[Candida] auris]